MNKRIEILFGQQGKVALVTGGTRGIGYMIAQGLLQAGVKVYINARNKENCDAAAEKLSEFGECISLPGVIVDEDSRKELVEIISRQHQRLDILVNNAGRSWGASYQDYPVASFEKVFGLNVTAMFALTRDLTPLLLSGASPENPSRVINIGSMDGLHQPTVDQTGTYAYTASKAAVHHMTRQLAVELGPKNITVNAVAPGYFESKMTTAIIDKHGDDVIYNCPLGRLGVADDMAGIAIFLSSTAGAYINGAIIPVDGGTSINHQHRSYD